MRIDLINFFAVTTACALLSGCFSTGQSDPVAEANGHRTASDVVATIQKMTASCRGYTAKVEMRSLDPNGGFDHFSDEQNVSLPDRILINRTILEAHNSDQEGASVTIVLNHGQMVSCMTGSKKWGRENDVTYHKANLKAVEQAGGPSVPETMAAMGNLADPLRQFNLSTLKLDKETSREWVLLAEFRQAGTPWRNNRITIDRETGFLRQIDAIIPELGEPVTVLKVNRVSAKYRKDDSVFRLDIPSGDASGCPYVMDDTHMWIESIEAAKVMGATKRQ